VSEVVAGYVFGFAMSNCGLDGSLPLELAFDPQRETTLLANGINRITKRRTSSRNFRVPRI
jgi:hypothetical protein